MGETGADTAACEGTGRGSYRPSRGAPCPACPGVGPTYATRRPVAGAVLRYHRCKRCGERFKTTEGVGEADAS
jgi:DnaJ-class molecular chaperone